MLRVFLPAALALFVLSLTAQTASASCEARLQSGPASASLTYRPFEPTPAILDLTLRVELTDGHACDLGVAFFSGQQEARDATGSTLDYQAQSRSGDQLMNQGTAPPASPAGLAVLRLPRLKGGGIRSATARLVVPQGQIPRPGSYTDAVRIALYDLGKDKLLADSTVLPVAISVEPVLRLSLAGGGQDASVDFGRMTDGESRVVLLRARSNAGFDLTLSSDNSGAMHLHPPVNDGRVWAVSYTVAVNGGAAVSLDRPRVVPVTSEATQLAGLTLPVEVVLGSTRSLRAGTYRDVVTIAIEPGF